MKKTNLILGILLIMLLATSGNLFAANNCLEFDGTDDRVDLGTGPLGAIDAMTVEAWVCADNTTNSKFVGRVRDGVCTYSYSLGIYNGKFYPEIYVSGDRLFCTSGTINANEWTHLALIYSKATNPGSTNDGRFIAYINGAEVYSTNHSLGSIDVTDASYTTILGGEPWSPFTHFIYAGKIDELRFWTDVHTATEIRENMYHELQGNEANLAGYYDFNETSGTTLNDNSSSGGTYHGTLINMTGNEWTVSPAFFGPKNCLDFDGSNDYINCGNDASLTEFNNFTMEAWVKLENSQDNQKILGKFDNWDPNGNYYFMGVGEGKHYSQINANGNEIDFSAGDVPSNEWTHLAVTFSKGTDGANGTFYGYVNGQIVYSKTDVADAAISVSHASFPFRIGICPWDPNHFKVDGQIDEVRIWNTQRSTAQIREYMTKSLAGNETGLAAYYSFDNTSGTTLQDFTGNGNDGTLCINMDDEDWVSSSAFNTWLNTDNSNWSTASNWSRGSAPGSTDNVGIYDYTGGTSPALSGTPTVNNFHYSINNLQFQKGQGGEYEISLWHI